MLDELLGVVTKLYEASDYFQQAEKVRQQRISAFFLNIHESLSKSIEQLNKGQVPHGEWEELKTYAEALPNIIDKEVGEEKAEELSRQLVNSITKAMPTENEIVEIKVVAGRFRGLAHTLPINDSLAPSVDSSRRRALIYTLLGSAGFAGSTFLEEANSHPISPFPSISWDMHTYLDDSVKDTIIFKAPQQVCDLVRRMTQGRFNISLIRTGGTEDILDKVHSGGIECGYSSIYYSKNKHRVLYFGCTIPFGLNPQEQIAWLNYKEKGKSKTYLQSVYEQLNLNIIPFPAGTTGSQMGGWFKKKVTSPDDLKGETMRIFGLGAEVLRRMGMNIHNDVTPTSIPLAINKLRSGRYLSVEWTSPYDDQVLGLNDAANFYYYPGWWEPSTTFDVHVNTSVWERLPPSYQEIFRLACHETYISTLAEYDLNNRIARVELKEKGVEYCRFSDKIMSASQKETEKLLSDYAANNAVFKDVYRVWSQFKKDIRAWHDLIRI
jgi:TRAP-type mannitol/chloroaromatic compound transport system substrate-binding protein